MEAESKKRAGREERESRELSQKKKSKKQHHINKDIQQQQQQQRKEKERYESESADECLGGVGVFDFPWLKEGMISKSEEWCLEDSFSFSLHDHDRIDSNYTTLIATLGDELCSWQCLSETRAREKESIDVSLDKFEEIVWPLEMLNQQPLAHPN